MDRFRSAGRQPIQSRVSLRFRREANGLAFKPIDDLGAKPAKVFLAEESYAIVGAAMEVYYKLGNGFLEPVYQEALEIKFGLRGVPFEREKWLKIDYKGFTLRKEYKADFLCYG